MIVERVSYRDGARVEPPQGSSVPPSDGDPSAFTWILLHDPTEAEIDEVSAECGLHELLLEDVRKAHQRAKWEVYDEAEFLVFKTVSYRHGEALEFGELQVILGDGFLITVRHGPGSRAGAVRQRLDRNPELLRRGPTAVVYALVDDIVDDYGPVIDALEDDVDAAEQAVFSASRENHAPRVYRLKREVLELSRNIGPVAEVLDDLADPHTGLVPDGLDHYFRDVADHGHRAIARIDVARELLSDALSANLAQQGVQQNDDMRRISAWAAVIAAPTLLAGLWGMNFEGMPELESSIGYPAALVAMAAVSGGLILYFRRVGWL